MFAVIRTGGKQYRVEKDNIVEIEKLGGSPGDSVVFDEVLMVDGTAGAPLVDGASVSAEILEQKKGEKALIFKKKRRKNYRRKKGHRQNLTSVRITDIKTA